MGERESEGEDRPGKMGERVRGRRNQFHDRQ